MRRVAAISAGPRSARPRGRRAFNLLDLSAMRSMSNQPGWPGGSSHPLFCHYPRKRIILRSIQTARRSMAQAQKSSLTSAVPNDLQAFFMPFTANRAFKARPRLIARAKDMHYYTPEGRPILDGAAGLWCTNAGHNRGPIVEAIQKQAAELDFAPTFQFGHPRAFELASRIAELAPADLDHVFFCNSGSEAADTAMKVALAYNNVRGEASRVRLIGRERGYHGVGFGGISVGGIVANRKMFGTALNGVDHLPHT